MFSLAREDHPGKLQEKAALAKISRRVEFSRTDHITIIFGGVQELFHDVLQCRSEVWDRYEQVDHGRKQLHRDFHQLRVFALSGDRKQLPIGELIPRCTNVIPVLPVRKDFFTFWRESQVLLHEHDAGVRQPYRRCLRMRHPNLLFKRNNRYLRLY